MKKRIIRWIGTFLVAAMLLTALPAFAESASTPKVAPLDVVLLLDCSQTLMQNDPDELCLAAVRNFVDTLPLQETRVSVVTFGYEGNGYSYGNTYPTDTYNPRRVHELIPLGNLSTHERKEAVKAAVSAELDEWMGNPRTRTPLGHALAAATDILTKNKTAKESGCIILISDGEEDPVPNGINDLKMRDKACQVASENEWRIYSIHLCYGSLKNLPSEMKKAVDFMEDISKRDGGGSLGRQECSNPEEVYNAFQQIFLDMLNKDPIPPVKVKVGEEYEFEVEEMASEVTLNVFGRGVSSVELSIKGSNQPPIVVNKTENKGNLIATVEKDYFQAKILCPQEGTWKAHIVGKNGAYVLVNAISMTEMGLDISAAAKGSNTAAEGNKFDRNTTLSVNAQLSYYGVVATNREFYVNHAKDAQIVVTNQDGSITTFDMSATKDGFYYDLPLSELPSGLHEMQVVFKYSKYRTGEKASDLISFSTDNLPLESLNKTVERNAYINSAIDRVDLTELFVNPDNDPIQYTLTCVNDRFVKFEVDEANARDGYLVMNSGSKEGVFEIEISAKDVDMATPVKGTLKLTVENRDPAVSEKFKKQEVWVDSYFWQKTPVTYLEMNLDDYFTDPDGMPLNYRITAGEAGVLETHLSGSILTLQPNTKGKTVLTVTANDGISEVSQELTVTSVSGRIVFWQHNWWWIAIAAAVFFFVVVAMVVALKNKKVKGTWNIEFEENGELGFVEKWNIAQFTKCGKKTRFLLRDALLELAEYVPDGTGDQWKNTIADYFEGSAASKIELVGVITKKGCHVDKVPKDPNVNVTVNGLKAQKLTSSGTLRIAIQKNDGSGSALVVNMKLK